MNSHKRNRFITIITPFGLFAAVITIWHFMGQHAANQDERGTYGDMFGAVNSLFSGLAFAGIVYTILLQRQELSLQREELRLTRLEMAKSVEAQKDSALALDKQVKLAAIAAQINATTFLLQDAASTAASIKAKIDSAGTGLMGGGGLHHSDTLITSFRRADKMEKELKKTLLALTAKIDLKNLDQLHSGESNSADECNNNQAG